MADKRLNNVTAISESTENGPSNGRIDGRLRDLEQNVIHIGTKLDTELRHLATREGLQEIKSLISARESTILRWLIGVISLGVVSLLTVLIKILLN